MAYLEMYNRDDIHARAIIVGIVNMLNQEVFFVNTHDNDDQEIVEVPFYYSTTGDERYLQDHFLEWRDCTHPKYLDGNFDPIPRGVVKLGDMSIDSGSLTQRWIRGEFQRVIDGKIQTFNAYLNSLPLTMTFEVMVQTDTMTDAFKTQQAILETFHKVQVFNTRFKGVMIPCQVGFPDNYPIEKQFEFSYPSDTKIELTFSLEVETYFPVFDEPRLNSLKALHNVNKDNLNDWLGKTAEGGNKLEDTTEPVNSLGVPMNNTDSTYFVGESRRNKITVRKGGKYVDVNAAISDAGKTVRRANNYMEDIIIGEFKNVTGIDNSSLTLISPTVADEFTSGETIDIKWEYEGFIHKVDLYYSLDYGNEWNIIKKFVQASNGHYEWVLPNFTNLLDVLVINEKGSGAVIQALVDINGSIYDVIVLEPGNNYDQTTTLEIEDTGDGVELIPSVIDGKITDVIIRNPGSGYSSTKQVEISFKITSSSGSTSDYLKDDSDNIGVILVK